MLECEIDNVAFGGEGVARNQGLVIFTPFTLPQEKVLVETYQKKSNFARAHLQKVLSPSPHRIEAPCPYFMRCGGCQLQHSSYSYQLELKKKFVEDSLKRIGKITFPLPPVIPSKDPFSYRRHITLQIAKTKGPLQLCFTSTDGSLLPIQSCLLFHLPEDPILTHLQKMISPLELPPACEGRTKILKTENGYVLAFTFTHTLSKKSLSLLASFQEINTVVGVIIQMPGDMVTFGDVSLTFSCHDLHFDYSPFSFLQNHAEQSSLIYKRLTEFLQNSRKILDLYCGIGVSSLLLAKAGKEVIGVEINPEAIFFAKQNALKNDIRHASFICSAADASTDELIKTHLPDAILVNPPKTGLDPLVKESFSHPCIKDIAYVSCHPPTLARDLSYLQTLGFSIQSIESYDMFPQTTHVETIVYLSKAL